MGKSLAGPSSLPFPLIARHTSGSLPLTFALICSAVVPEVGSWGFRVKANVGGLAPALVCATHGT